MPFSHPCVCVRRNSDDACDAMRCNAMCGAVIGEGQTSDTVCALRSAAPQGQCRVGLRAYLVGLTIEDELAPAQHLCIASASAMRDVIRALGKGALAHQTNLRFAPSRCVISCCDHPWRLDTSNCSICNSDSLAYNCSLATVVCACIQPPTPPPLRVVAMSFFARLVGKKQTDGDDTNANKDKQAQQQQTQKQQGEEADKNETTQSSVAPRAIGGLPRINVTAGHAAAASAAQSAASTSAASSSVATAIPSNAGGATSLPLSAASVPGVPGVPGAGAAPPMPNMSSCCPAEKWRYESCFQKWYSAEYLTGKSTDLSGCQPMFDEYRSCVIVSAHRRHFFPHARHARTHEPAHPTPFVKSIPSPFLDRREPEPKLEQNIYFRHRRRASVAAALRRKAGGVRCGGASRDGRAAV